MDSHPSYQLDIIKAEYAQYQAGYRPDSVRYSNFAPLRGILRSLTRRQRG